MLQPRNFLQAVILAHQEIADLIARRAGLVVDSFEGGARNRRGQVSSPDFLLNDCASRKL
jgi:hypothetical protein